MFVLYADKTQLTVREKEPITSGSVNVYPVRIEFSADWDGLEKTIIFQAGCAEKPIPLTGGACTIPPEVLVAAGYFLAAGVCGKMGEDTVRPTIWTTLGLIQEGAVPRDAPAPTPRPEDWQKALEGKGDRLAYTDTGELGLYARDKLLSSVPVMGGGGGNAWGVGHGLKVVGGELTVDTTDDFSGDNTLPMTAAGVQVTVGNIEALLGTI